MVHSYIKKLCIALGFSLAACMSDDDSTAVSDRQMQAEREDTTAAEAPLTTQAQQFYAVPIKNFKAFTIIRDSLGDARTELLLKINRRDRKHIRKNDTLIA